MYKETTWRPDTCDCTIVYSWDDGVDETNRIHTPVSAAGCGAHAGLSPQAIYETVLQENRRKNTKHAQVATLLPDHLRLRDEEGNLTESTVDGVVNFFYDQRRDLHVLLHPRRVDEETRKRVQEAHSDLKVH